MSTSKIATSGLSRVWLIENGVSPYQDPDYMGCMKLNDPSWAQGDITRIECPDPKQFGKFVESGSVRGAQERVTTGVMGRYSESLSDLLRLARKGCRIDLQAHMGACKRGADPQDYLAGWAKIIVFRDANITNYAHEGAGALSSDENAAWNETADISAEEMYEIVPLSFGQQASALTTRQVYTIDVCDNADCGECDEPSDGCQRVFAAMVGVGATPGTIPSVLYTEDGGATWDSVDIDTMFSNEIPIDADCVGTRYVIISHETNSFHYAETDDIIAGAPLWVEVTTGFVAAGPPNSMYALDPRHIWVVGDGGYIYFSSNITVGVEVQDAGVASGSDLYDVHAYDANNVAAVGAGDAVVYTENGGETWQAVAGPAVGVNLRAIWMLSPTTWLVGDQNGGLWSTRNSGQSWQAVGVPANIARIDDIRFVDDTVGYIAARTNSIGVLMRTTNGGRDWYILPESGIALPDTDYFNQVAVCSDPQLNTMFAAGLAGDATSGMIVKGAGA